MPIRHYTWGLPLPRRTLGKLTAREGHLLAQLRGKRGVKVPENPANHVLRQDVGLLSLRSADAATARSPCDGCHHLRWMGVPRRRCPATSVRERVAAGT